ncbi:MAG TPA: helix-turn-helix transcriptional regulator [Candidatus Dormibacteraeota bacterium]|jgi:DNA-binding CsgD family transcriptional regulator|nr:helix-turn-helix transcriptional regulator [Candidatus Dormibacteraeota bacterium]
MGKPLTLSRRQRQVIDLVASGCSDKEIAHRLRLSTATVKTYLGRIYRHHGFRNRAEAAAASVMDSLSKAADDQVSSSLNGMVDRLDPVRFPSANDAVNHHTLR